MERDRRGEKTLTKAQWINNQPSRLGWVSSHVCWIQTTGPVRMHLSAGQTKERERERVKIEKDEKKRGRQSQEASLKIPPSLNSGILSIFLLGYCVTVCVPVCICCVQLLYVCECAWRCVSMYCFSHWVFIIYRGSTNPLLISALKMSPNVT